MKCQNCGAALINNDDAENHAAECMANEPHDYCTTCGKAQPVRPVYGDDGPYGVYCLICNNSIGSHGDIPF